MIFLFFYSKINIFRQKIKIDIFFTHLRYFLEKIINQIKYNYDKNSMKYENYP